MKILLRVRDLFLVGLIAAALFFLARLSEGIVYVFTFRDFQANLSLEAERHAGFEKLVQQWHKKKEEIKALIDQSERSGLEEKLVTAKLLQEKIAVKVKESKESRETFGEKMGQARERAFIIDMFMVVLLLLLTLWLRSPVLRTGCIAGGFCIGLGVYEIWRSSYGVDFSVGLLLLTLMACLVLLILLATQLYQTTKLT